MLIYATVDGNVNIEILIDAATVWLTPQQIAQLYGESLPIINEHLKDIFEEEELQRNICIKKFGIPEF